MVFIRKYLLFNAAGEELPLGSTNTKGIFGTEPQGSGLQVNANTDMVRGVPVLTNRSIALATFTITFNMGLREGTSGREQTDWLFSFLDKQPLRLQYDNGVSAYWRDLEIKSIPFVDHGSNAEITLPITFNCTSLWYQNKVISGAGLIKTHKWVGITLEQASWEPPIGAPRGKEITGIDSYYNSLEFFQADIPIDQRPTVDPDWTWNPITAENDGSLAKVFRGSMDYTAIWNASDKNTSMKVTASDNKASAGLIIKMDLFKFYDTHFPKFFEGYGAKTNEQKMRAIADNSSDLTHVFDYKVSATSVTGTYHKWGFYLPIAGKWKLDYTPSVNVQREVSAGLKTYGTAAEQALSCATQDGKVYFALFTAGHQVMAPLKKSLDLYGFYPQFDSIVENSGTSGATDRMLPITNNSRYAGLIDSSPCELRMADVVASGQVSWEVNAVGTDNGNRTMFRDAYDLSRLDDGTFLKTSSIAGEEVAGIFYRDKSNFYEGVGVYYQDAFQRQNMGASSGTIRIPIGKSEIYFAGNVKTSNVVIILREEYVSIV